MSCIQKIGISLKVIARALGPAARRERRGLARAQGGAVSLEFAFAAVPFMLLLLGTLEISYDMLMQSILNYSTAVAARMIWTGKVQANEPSASFINTSLCPVIGSLLDCNLLTVRTTPIRPAPTMFDVYMKANSLPNYVSGGAFNVAGWSVCSGNDGDEILFEAVYAAPTFIGGFITVFAAKYSGSLAHPIYSSYGFVNSNGYPATAGC